MKGGRWRTPAPLTLPSPPAESRGGRGAPIFAPESGASRLKAILALCVFRASAVLSSLNHRGAKDAVTAQRRHGPKPKSSCPPRFGGREGRVKPKLLSPRILRGERAG